MPAETESASQDAADSATRRPSRWKRRVTLVSALLAIVSAAVVLPPLINMGRYQRQITALVSRSVGRPVHLSSVELRLLPTPGFVLNDLSIGEDPAFGAEPVLSARTVVASVRIFSLWRGKMEISRISVDEASLNLVRAANGRWNLESLMLGAQPALTGAPAGNESIKNGSTKNGSIKAGKPVRFPYLEATDSRVNLKNGAEKSPFSIVNTDLSLWQDDPGQWRVRLRGAPVRTDLEMNQADTGEVRLEASLHTAAQLRDMPLKLQMDWRDAQLGQLSRLLTGSDAGWRGDVAANIEVQGTLDAAQTRGRLRVTGVRRVEFAPETPLDFDANCNFRYQHTQNAFHEVGCDTDLGDGHLHLKAELPGDAGSPEAMLEVKQVPLQAVLGLVRTVRSGFAPDVTARGTANGRLTYKIPPAVENPVKPALRLRKVLLKSKRTPAQPAPSGALTGTITFDSAVLKDGALKEPLALPAIAWTPASTPDSTQLATQFNIAMSPGKEAAPGQAITVRISLGAEGYNATIRGSGETAKLRELAYAFGIPHPDAAALEAVDSFANGTADLDLAAAGPWIFSQNQLAPIVTADTVTSSSSQQSQPFPSSDGLTGTLHLHHTQWTAPYLAHPVDLVQGTLTLSANRISLSSDFNYGDAKQPAKSLIRGSVEVTDIPDCKAADCRPQVVLHFGSLNAATVQAALLGTPAEKSLLSPLLNRMRSGDRPKLPPVALTVDAEGLELGPAALHKPKLQMHIEESAIVLDRWEASVLNTPASYASGTGRITWPEGTPTYTLQGSFSGINAADLGAMLGADWSGGPVKGTGSIELSGVTEKDLAASATGELKFTWPHGTFEAAPDQALHFDSWSGSVIIKANKAQLAANAILAAKRSTTIAGGVTFGGPVKLSVANAAPEQASELDHAAAKTKAATPTVQ